MSTNTDDLRIRKLRELLIPEQLIEEMPAQGGIAEHVTASRGAISCASARWLRWGSRSRNCSLRRRLALERRGRSR